MTSSNYTIPVSPGMLLRRTAAGANNPNVRGDGPGFKGYAPEAVFRIEESQYDGRVQLVAHRDETGNLAPILVRETILTTENFEAVDEAHNVISPFGMRVLLPTGNVMLAVGTAKAHRYLTYSVHAEVVPFEDSSITRLRIPTPTGYEQVDLPVPQAVSQGGLTVVIATGPGHGPAVFAVQISGHWAPVLHPVPVELR